MRKLLIALAAAALTACGGADVKLGAAQDVRAFLVAVKAGDETAFNRHVDRTALRASLREQIAEASGAGALGALFAGPQADAALDRLIAPETFQLAWSRSGLPMDAVPPAPAIATQLRVLDEQTVCIPQPQAATECVMTFRREEAAEGAWRLVDVRVADVRVG